MMESELAAKLRQLYEDERLQPLGADEFCVGTFMALVGCDRNEADKCIREQLAAGQIVDVGGRLHRGRRVHAYRFA